MSVSWPADGGIAQYKPGPWPVCATKGSMGRCCTHAHRRTSKAAVWYKYIHRSRSVGGVDVRIKPDQVIRTSLIARKSRPFNELLLVQIDWDWWRRKKGNSPKQAHLNTQHSYRTCMHCFNRHLALDWNSDDVRLQTETECMWGFLKQGLKNMFPKKKPFFSQILTFFISGICVRWALNGCFFKSVQPCRKVPFVHNENFCSENCLFVNWLLFCPL